jgi:hypothetical protein
MEVPLFSPSTVKSSPCDNVGMLPFVSPLLSTYVAEGMVDLEK